jgi:hypothetical protein
MTDELGNAGAAWLAGMPDAVARQRALLERLLVALGSEPALTGLTVGCSLARGAGDEWSDIDAGLAVDADAWPGVVGRALDVVRAVGDVVDVLDQPWPFGERGTARHVFTQYADGTQLSLVVAPGAWWAGHAPGDVVLRDTDRTLAPERRPRSLAASADDVREWAFEGWIALADLVKYVARGSSWEALARLTEARHQVWRLWAVAHGVAYPTFGMTAVLDEPAAGLPPGIEGTVADLDLPDLLGAARRLADLLDDVSARAAAAVPGVALPRGMAAHVRGMLATVP